MKPILLFDADGVIINGKMFSLHLEDDFGISTEMTKHFFTTIFSDCLEGKADLKEEIKPYLKEWGWNKGVDKFLEYWFDVEHVVDERLIELIQSFRKNGIKCFVATNQEHHRTNYMRKEMVFDKWFDGVFSSADLGHKKPNIDFFQELFVKIGLPDKATTWFFDDTQKNIEGAEEFGINSKLYTDFENYKKLVTNEDWLVK
jgi:putative hydrolase of the HAD superfamily